ncbi:MAG: response regulator transcription factor [Rhodocyclaceae bacterium]|nr:response regulator transcription factor [Rhodocyclaceae bacterium]
MRLLLIEDDDALADGVVRALRIAGYLVDRAADGREADTWLSEREYDLVVLDLGLPGLDGSEVLRRLRARKQGMPVIVVSAREMLDERIRLLDLGADDYLVKPVAISELEARIRVRLRRGMSSEDNRLRIGELVLDLSGRLAWIGERPLELTAREWSALEYLATRANRIVSKDLVLQALYHWDAQITPNAVEKIISRLRAKLEPAGVVIRTVRGMGYYLEQPKPAVG